MYICIFFNKICISVHDVTQQSDIQHNTCKIGHQYKGNSAQHYSAVSEITLSLRCIVTFLMLCGVIMLCVIMLTVIVLGVIMLCVIMLRVITVGVIMLSDIII